jgi:hypothetical protein
MANNKRKFEDYSKEGQYRLFRVGDPRVPQEYIDHYNANHRRRVARKEWQNLCEATKKNLWEKGDERVPADYSPPCLQRINKRLEHDTKFNKKHRGEMLGKRGNLELTKKLLLRQLTRIDIALAEINRIIKEQKYDSVL